MNVTYSMSDINVYHFAGHLFNVPRLLYVYSMSLCYDLYTDDSLFVSLCMCFYVCFKPFLPQQLPASMTK